ncbi:MAG: phosphotransferase [Pirellulales bacterium]|nr:phosphotransferase [Pirellulales bacterium]
MSHARIQSIARSLPLWQNRPVEIKPLTGGITNQNFVVRDGVEQFVVRLCADGMQLGIDRRSEAACHRAAAAAGVAPELVHHEPDVLVTRFVAGETLTAARLQDHRVLRRVALALRRLHADRSRIVGEMLEFSGFAASRTYAVRARRWGAELPADIDAILEDAGDLERSLAPTQPSLCHNDLLPANLIDDGRQTWIVDWELAGVGHPMFDLGGLASNAGLDAAAEEELLTACFDRVTPAAQRELAIFKAVSLLREALWGAVQSASATLDFDYRQYAAVHFERYRAARANIRD